ncbi:hypothetical protein [Streptomyces microflavus]|uniref:hypothetical protein n=1 Tax=Streptomyces microflavus TaxID=1919 RepID=UPI0033E87548
MWRAPAVRRNAAQLRADGHTILTPDATDTLTDPDRSTGVGPTPAQHSTSCTPASPAVNRTPQRT